MSTHSDEQLEVAAEALRRQEVHVPDPAIISGRLTARRQRRAAWAVSLVVLCVIGVVAIVSATADHPSQVTSGPSPASADVAVPTPLPSPGALGLWVDDATPAVGQVVAIVLVNRSPVVADVGVGAALERMVDGTWEPTGRTVSLCLAEWQCTGSIGGSSAAVPLIGIQAASGGVGSLTLLRLDGLDPGIYRISQSTNGGSTASAVIEVHRGEQDPFSAADVVGHRLEISPPLVTDKSASQVLLRVVGEHLGEQAVTAPLEVTTVEVTTLVDGRWGSPRRVDVRRSGESELEMDVPSLPEGPHRVRLLAGDEHLDGYLWTVADL